MAFESMSAKMGKSVHDIVWNHREGGREGFRLPQQSVRVEAGQQTIGDERVHVPGSEVLLLETGRTKLVELGRVPCLEGLLFIRKAG